MEGQVFVARERELGQLDGFLYRALAGQGQVCFVMGEAGSGKTALVTEFARCAQEQYADLIVAVGQSDAQTGIGDPYLPFREVLGQLTGDVKAKLAQGAITEENADRLRRLLRFSGQALVEVGPDLIGIFVPAAGLATRVAAFVAGEVGWLNKLKQLIDWRREGAALGSTGMEQGHVFEQYTNVLKALAVQRPLMLVVDDLQWADAASIGLLFRLGRRIGESRILIVGTYRPDEVAIGRAGERHPLEKVLAEFKGHFGDIWVDLGQIGEADGWRFVDGLLDTEPNRLGQGFRRALYGLTGGHALFTVELLRDMQERGDIVRDEGCRWVEGPSLNWRTLPARVEGVMEERIGRLDEELRETLTVASVEGESFAAEVVARVRKAGTRGLIRRLSHELEKQHRLVSAQGIRWLGAQRLSLYRFRHNLFQKYLYDGLDEVERAVLHEDVGNVLEDLYGAHVDEIFVQLTRHFVAAGVVGKAVHYLHRAGEQAAARFANAEAVDYFSRALDLTPETDTTWRCALLMAREKVYDVQGAREAQSRDLAALEALTEALEVGGQQTARKRAEVALRRANYAEATSDYPGAVAAAQAAIHLAQASQDEGGQAAGYLLWGRALVHQRNYAAARSRLEDALALAQAKQLRQVEADSLLRLGVVCYFQGDSAQAMGHYRQALDIYREVGDRRGESRSLGNLGVVSRSRGDYAGARVYFEQVLRLSREIGHREGEGKTLANLGIVCRQQGDYTEASGFYGQALGVFRETGDRGDKGLTLIHFGIVSCQQGDYAGARAYFNQALGIFREIGDRGGEGWALAFLGLLFHQLGDDEAAQTYSQQALCISRDIGEPSIKGYALTNLGRALAGLGHLADAADAYQQAVSLRRELGEPHLAMESLAGLARVSLAQGDASQAQALAQVEEILSYLETGTLDGTEEPFRIYLTCYRVLRASQDPRARTVLNTAHRLLGERAAQISDEELRRSFLDNVAVHREIVSEFTNAG